MTMSRDGSRQCPSLNVPPPQAAPHVTQSKEELLLAISAAKAALPKAATAMRSTSQKQVDVVTILHGSGRPCLDSFASLHPGVGPHPGSLRAELAGAGIWPHPRRRGGQNRSKQGPTEPCTTVTKADLKEDVHLFAPLVLSWCSPSSSLPRAAGVPGADPV